MDAKVIVVRRCAVAEILQASNIAELVEEYAAESSIAGLPHPRAKMETYYGLEAAGIMAVFGAFSDGALAGFISVLTTTNPHYSVILSVSESFFVANRYRKTGAGLKLLRVAEAHAQKVGALGLLISSPYGGTLERILPRVGYVPSNTIFFRRFADA